MWSNSIVWNILKDKHLNLRRLRCPIELMISIVQSRRWMVCGTVALSTLTLRNIWYVVDCCKKDHLVGLQFPQQVQGCRLPGLQDRRSCQQTVRQGSGAGTVRRALEEDHCVLCIVVGGPLSVGFLKSVTGRGTAGGG